MIEALERLKAQLSGSLHTDELHQMLYATDASVYRKIPLAVAYPKDQADLQRLLEFAQTHKTGLIPRTAGTSLAGQVVGSGIVVDVSKHFTQILHLDKEARTVTVQPGVIRDELNAYLEPFGLFFGPNTSTSNRCMIGGMVGNNSSGTTSIQYGVTRDKVMALEVLLSDGSLVQLEDLDKEAWSVKCQQTDLEGEIYALLDQHLSQAAVQQAIQNEFPKASIHRRNTGYAIDALMGNTVFGEGQGPINLSKLLCGSEGTLAFTTSITLALDPLPPEQVAMIVPQYKSISACLQDVKPAMEHELYSCEMLDRVILDCTAQNKTYAPMRFFIDQEPEALLLLEVRAQTKQDLEVKVADLKQQLDQSGKAYAAPVLYGTQIDQAMTLRKAGLGLLGNMVGDRKAVACIEDTAVALDDLAPYIAEFEELMKGFGQEVVYYAHAGAGELHLRPILNLKDAKDLKDFRAITTAVARLVKKYQGSLSGEHGDGIVRAEFLESQIGTANFELLKQIKGVFDPNNIFNPGKITDAWPMDENLRYSEHGAVEEVQTFLNFEASGGLLHLAENCNGSGDCRKSEQAGGVMCPSYHASQDEKDTTRGRANVLRELLTREQSLEAFSSEALSEAMDLCLGCKGCSSECPSNVNIALVKSEFEYQSRKQLGEKKSDRLFGLSSQINQKALRFRSLVNAVIDSPVAGMLKSWGGIHPSRSLPKYSKYNLSKKVYTPLIQNGSDISKVFLYVDEFTRAFDASLALDAVTLLTSLGYEVELVDGLDSARAMISKGYLEQAREKAYEHLEYLKDRLIEGTVLLGIEPSAILGLRDEFPLLLSKGTWDPNLSKRSLLIEEFIEQQAAAGYISPDRFTQESARLKIHVHCHQKALGSAASTFQMLNLPLNYKPTIIAAGCCGMAGSFGFEKDHYDLSMKIGELRLFPVVRKASEETIVVANGTSCRHQILDGTGRKALHPITVLKQALV